MAGRKGVWCGPVHHVDDVLGDEHVAANGYMTTLDDGLARYP